MRRKATSTWSKLEPQAKILFVTSASTAVTQGMDLASAYAVDNATAPIISLSYGQCEGTLNTACNAFWNQLWQQAASEGITVFVSSGDSGRLAALAEATG